jgi:hypothetical protein
MNELAPGAATTGVPRTIFLARDYQSLSLFRILFAVYLGCYFFYELLPYYGDFFTDHGILPRAVLLASYPDKEVLSLLTVSDYWLFHVLFAIAHILAIVAFGFGYKTRWANFILFVTCASLYWRNPMIDSSAERLAKLLLLWCLFLPMARYWSVDAALDPEPRDRPYSNIPFFGIKIQIAVIYFFSALYKLAGTTWWDGSAVSLALKDNLFGGTPLGLLAANSLDHWLWLATYGIILFQLFFSFLVYWPWSNNLTRGVALLGAVCMHASFLFLLNVGFFPYLCLAYLVILVPDEWWNSWLTGRRARLNRIRIFYEPGCEFCKKTALLFREFCLPSTVPVRPADQNAEAFGLLRQNKSWIVYDTDGEILMHWRAVAYVLRQNPVFWIFGALTDIFPLHLPMRKLYDWIGAHRPLLSKGTAILLPLRTSPPIGPAATVFCAFLIMLMLAFAVSAVRKPVLPFERYQEAVANLHVQTPGWLTDLAGFFQVLQRWSIFAPNPDHFERRYTLTGTMVDGTTVNLMSRWSPPLFEMDANHYTLNFVNAAWLKYFSRLLFASTEQQNAFALYACRHANGHEETGSGLMRTIHFEIAMQPDDRPWNGDEKPMKSWDYFCPQIEPAIPSN